jgi:aspartyl-tRNA(Asn)/glutamyl-tRNA(Gln) amidotransferase subunit A
MALSWTLDKLGPMCRSAADCAHVLNALAGRDPLDPSSRDATFRYPLAHTSRGRTTKNGARPLRLGVLKDSYEKAQDAVRDNFLASLEVLKKMGGVELTKDVTLPDFPYGPAVGTIVDAEGASAFRDLIESGRVKELASPTGRIGGYSTILTPAVDYLHAMRMRAPMRRAWGEMFKKFDLLVAPSRSTVANPVAKTFDQGWPPPPTTSPIGASNLVGVPAISVPNGFGLMGLPTGIQFVAPAWGEEALIDIALRYQQATDWHRRRPTLS